MEHGVRDLVVWSAALTVGLAACGRVKTSGSRGSGGAAALGGPAATGGMSATSGDTRGGAGDATGGTAGAAGGSPGATGGSPSRGGASTGGGSSGGGDAVVTVDPNPELVAPTTVAELCASFPGDWGDLMARCYGGDAADWASFGGFSCNRVADADADGRLTLNQGRVDACYAVLAGGRCVFGPGELRAPCDSLIVGNVPIGEACVPLDFGGETETECVPEAYCSAMGNCGGFCRVLGQEGDGCYGLYVDTICAPALWCSADSAQCVVPQDEGEPCGPGLGDCGQDRYCDVDGPDDGDGICRPLELEGGPCRGSGECAPGLRCDAPGGGDGVCVKLKRVGDECTFGLRECPGYCSPEGICRLVARENEPCGSLADSSGNSSEYVWCGAGLFCDRLSLDAEDAVCRRQAPLGGECPDTRLSGKACDDSDANTYCDMNTCTACAP